MRNLGELTILPDGNLKLALTDEGKEEIAALRLRPSDIALGMVLDHELGNGWDWINPEEIAALTESPILSNEVSWDDAGNIIALGQVWWFPQYETVDPIAELEREGFIIFTAGE